VTGRISWFWCGQRVFTDPGYGILANYEGYKHPLELKEAVYRIDKPGVIEKVSDELYKPNGLCFSPDYKKLYVCDTGVTHYPEAPRIVQVYDLVDGKTLRNGKRVFSVELTAAALSGHNPANVARPGAGIADGIKCDTEGNLWCGMGAGGPGYDGVHVFTPDGQRIGMIVLPENTSNVCFGGQKRNRLFITASQSIYAVYVEAQGAHIC